LPHQGGKWQIAGVVGDYWVGWLSPSILSDLRVICGQFLCCTHIVRMPLNLHNLLAHFR